MLELDINGRTRNVDVEEETPLLWVLREQAGLTGTKYGCGIAQCGACTVRVEGEALRSCVTPVGSVEGKRVVTIEYLPSTSQGPTYRAVRQAWIDKDVVQCGYCQSGQIMTAVALLAKKPDPTDADIDHALSGNICRCGTYVRVREAIHLAARLKRGAP